MLVVLSGPLLQQSKTQQYITETQSWGTGPPWETGSTQGYINSLNFSSGSNHSFKRTFQTIAVPVLSKVCAGLDTAYWQCGTTPNLPQGTGDSSLTLISDM